MDIKKTQEEVYAEGMQISSNLKLLAERRTDIFGMEETVIGQKIGEEEAPKAPNVQWDGHAARWVVLMVFTLLPTDSVGVVCKIKLNRFIPDVTLFFCQ